MKQHFQMFRWYFLRHLYNWPHTHADKHHNYIYQHPPPQCDFQLLKHLRLGSSLYSNTRHILIRSKTAAPQHFTILFLCFSFIVLATMSLTKCSILLLNIMAVIMPSFVTPHGKGSPFPWSLLPILEIASFR